MGTQLLADLARRGVANRILTKSLEVTDVPPVHAACSRYRRHLLEAGVELLELRALRNQRPDRNLPDILAGSASGPHARVFGFDRQRIFVGSYNLDPRSGQLDTEMGFLIDNKSLATTLARALDQPAFACRVTFDGNGALKWTESDPDGEVREFDSEPNASRARRATAAVIEKLTVEWRL